MMILQNKNLSKREFEIIKLLWQKGPISRYEIAKELHISKVLVTQNTDKLLKKGIINECVAVSGSRGRRPVPLRIRQDCFYSFGISFLKRSVSKIALINANAEVLKESIISEFPEQWQKQCNIVIDIMNEMLQKYGIPWDKVAGVGIALTGITNPLTGEVFSSSQFVHKKKFNLAKYFEEKIKKEIFLINTCHLTALVEHRWGDAKNMNTFLTFHTGFGLGMFLHGILYRGHQCHAGEIGMMQLQPFGERCVDGRCGVLGVLAPFRKITKTLKNIILQGGNTLVKDYININKEEITLETVIKAIENGDLLCSRMMAEHFEIIARAIVNLAYIFNPEAIFLPAWTSRCPDVSIEIVKKMMGHYGISNWELHTEVLPAKCTDADLAAGAALLPVEYAFKNQNIFPL